MKLWIIHKDEIGFSNIIAEILQNRLEDYIDVFVGNAKRIDPSYVVEEKLDFLIIGDIISKEIPNLEIKDWFLKFWELSNKKKVVLKAISGYYIALAEIIVEPFWVKFLHDNVKVNIIYPPILRLILNSGDISLENKAYDKVKDYSNDLIEYFVENKRKKKNY
ncbi:MAG: hypothetical protein ACFE9I_13485 [Candidatus Hermodarchaeota archaeon]